MLPFGRVLDEISVPFTFYRDQTPQQLLQFDKQLF